MGWMYPIERWRGLRARGGVFVSGGPFDGKAVITGAGKSQVGRRLGRTGLDLTLEAVLRAIADAGLSVDDVDGIASYPGPGVPDAGFSGATVQEVRNALGLRSRWYISAMETAGQIGPAIEANMLVYIKNVAFLSFRNSVTTDCSFGT